MSVTTTTLTGVQPNNYTFNRTLSGRVMYGYDIDDDTGCTPGYTEFCSAAGVTEWTAPVDCLDKPVWRQLLRLRSDGYRPVIVKEATTGTWTAAGWTKNGTAQELAEASRNIYDAVHDHMAFGSFSSSFVMQVVSLDLGTGVMSVADPRDRTGKYFYQVTQATDRLNRGCAPDVYKAPVPEMSVRFEDVDGMVEAIVYPRDRDHGQCPIYGDLFTWGMSAYRPSVSDPYDALAEALELTQDPDEKSGKKVVAAPCAGSAAVVQ